MLVTSIGVKCVDALPTAVTKPHRWNDYLIYPYNLFLGVLSEALAKTLIYTFRATQPHFSRWGDTFASMLLVLLEYLARERMSRTSYHHNFYIGGSRGRESKIR